DFGSPDAMWRNDGGGFTAVGARVLRTTSASSMGVDFADVDRDGDVDFVTTEMLAFDPVRRRMQTGSTVPSATPPGFSASRVAEGRNVLQLNRGDGTFAEVGRAAGLHASEWTWGAMFLDVDLDGFEDLLVANGHAWDPLDGDTQEALQSGRITVDWREELGVFPRLALRNLAFRNGGDGVFVESGADWGFGGEPDVSHALGSADLDRDGDLDVIISRLEGEPLVLRNEAGGARVAVRLLETGGNTQAVGARVTLEGGAVPRQSRQVTSGGMYLSGSDPMLAFAMGDSPGGRLRVEWPDGATTELAVETNRAYEVRHPRTAPAERRQADPAAGSRAALFEAIDVTVAHTETVFDELARQPLIPLELSRLGPGVSWEDVDRDGDPDLIVAAPSGGRASLLMNEEGVLASPVPVGAATPGDQTTILGTIGPAGYTLVVGVSNWEGRTPEEAASVPPLFDLGGSGGPLLPGDFNTTGPVAQADVNGDGFLDLFVGGRALPGAYPLPAGSRLLLGGSSGWEEDVSLITTLRSIGMVSGAVFSDIDSDGDPDLVLALEWGTVRLLLNDQGRFTEATDDWGLGDHTGRWNGIATGDLNGDGRPDLVATSWGVNVDYPPTPERPAVGVASDFDGNGQIDFIEATVDEAGRVVPTRGYLTLATALPFIRRTVPTFEAFSRATLEDLVDNRDGEVYRVSAATYSHTAFLNRGGRFESLVLPGEAQRAPAFGVVVGDVDRDGNEDIYLAQNFLATPLGIGRHDAGRGALLLGDGAGGLEYVDAGLAGAPVYADARGAAFADFDLDGRWDLAVGLNGEGAAIFHGIGGEPGLRVSLRGRVTNPDAIGARIRVVYADGVGPAREVQSGSGYWSRNGATQVFGLRTEPTAVRVRWPDGSTTERPLDAGSRELTIVAGAP
ncbi:MAG: FG-GAP-like repeat-containing protein, partial [Gemmatimonadota bacterium]|nr:FG-GAP-like repeat-containing protein [Gemmatimonadota bacterium]